ncbi:YlbL family protein [Bacillus sp. FJAT-44742]|uniref:YlbL family protein n=1 Tax=Bacillus sp. FJAT-44742 TaxID=2014005 RepID=UPI000C235758|nr:PDZ domain-containing protein [Bacillus sp. FJAT-44742]
METKKKRGISRSWIAVILIIALLAVYQIPLPYYYSQPGEAVALADMIEVTEGYGEEGQFYLTTIRQRRANLPLYMWAQMSDYRELLHEELFLRSGETDEEYFHRQTMLMTDSQEAAKIVAYREAGHEVNIEYQGVRVTEVIDEMDAANHLEEGDLIQEINGQRINTLDDLHGNLDEKEAGDEVELLVVRENEEIEVTVKMDTFPSEMDDTERAGLGIMYPVTEREVTFEPATNIEAGAIGGPSAGLMFSLEIYNQLTEGDITKGLNIAGSGSIDEDGNIGRIGGIKQKVVAAENSGIDVFFAPDDDLGEISNYEEAMEAAEDINAEMEVVAVETFDDAITFLESYEP